MKKRSLAECIPMSRLSSRFLIFGYRGFLGASILEKLNQYFFINLESINDLNNGLLKNIDVFINCAGAASVYESYNSPSMDFEKNSLLVRQILEKIRLSGNKNIKFVNLSSAAVYGNPDILPIHENSLINPISPYGFHKKIAEDICLEYSLCFGLKTMSLRIFSAYGSGQKKMLLWDLHQKIINSQGQVTLFGTGEESRDFIHIDDIFQQLMLAINHAEFHGEAINVANGEEVTINQIARLYQKHHPTMFEFHFNGDNRPGDPLNWCADISLMKKWGYKQKMSIEEGVKEYINWTKVI